MVLASTQGVSVVHTADMRRILAVLAGAGLIMAGCRGSDGSTSLSVTVTEPAAGRVTFSAPSTVKAGRVEMKLKNSGKQPHDGQLIRIEGDQSMDEVLAQFGAEDAPIPAWLHAEGGVGTVAPGQSLSATMVLEPGRYYIVDTNTDADNNSFAEQGGIRELTVEGEAAGATLPEVKTKITAREYGFGVPSDLKAGSATVKFENAGSQLHHLVAVPIEAGKTIEDVRRAFTSGDGSQPTPLNFEKATGASTVDGGKSLVTRMTLQRGSYAFICFLNDRAGGPPHFVLGMLQEVKVA